MRLHVENMRLHVARRLYILSKTPVASIFEKQKFGILNTLYEELSHLFVDTGGWLNLVKLWAWFDGRLLCKA